MEKLISRWPKIFLGNCVPVDQKMYKRQAIKNGNIICSKKNKIWLTKSWFDPPKDHYKKRLQVKLKKTQDNKKNILRVEVFNLLQFLWSRR